MDKQVFLNKLHHKQARHSELFALLERNYSDEEATEIKKRISAYYLKKLTNSLEQQTIDEGWTRDTFAEWTQAHARAKAEN